MKKFTILIFTFLLLNFNGSVFAAKDSDFCLKLCSKMMSSIHKVCEDMKDQKENNICFKSLIYPEAGIFDTCKNNCAKYERN